MGSDEDMVLEGSASKVSAMKVWGSEFDTGKPYFFKYSGMMIWNPCAGRLAEGSLGVSGQPSRLVCLN